VITYLHKRNNRFYDAYIDVSFKLKETIEFCDVLTLVPNFGNNKNGCTCIAVECNPESDYSYKKQWSFTFNNLLYCALDEDDTHY